MAEKKQRKSKGGRPIKHGAWSLIARGELPQRQRQLSAHLTQVREELIHDLGPSEDDLTGGQKLLIARVISLVGIIRLMEIYASEHPILSKDGKLLPCLGENYLAWVNSLRQALLALGIKRAPEKFIHPLEMIEAEEEKKAESTGKG